MKGMLLFEMQYDGQPDIEDLKQGFERWKLSIEINADRYDIKTLSVFDNAPNLGQLEVTYEGKKLFDVNFYKKYYRQEKGKKGVCGMFTVKCADDGKELTSPGEMICLNIDDHLGVNYLGKQTHIVDALQDVLPIRDERDVKKIMDVFGVSAAHIKMDTYQKRYVIDSVIPELQWKEEAAPKVFYKYVTLDVFHKMLLNGTYRMNSIISQSDTQETFYIGDLVCRDYEDEYKRFRGMLNDMNTLISSFTTRYDDAYMWNEYGDKGKGVCLCFHLKGDRILRQIRYVDEERSAIMRYKKMVDELKNENIRLHFTAVDDVHRFVKNSKYSLEEEWRLLLEYDGVVDYDLYGQRCVSYKDFKFQGCELPEIGLFLDSILVGPNQPEGTDNFPLLTQRVYQRFGDKIIVNRSQVDKSIFMGN